MILVVYRSALGDVTAEALRYGSLATRVWEALPGVLHLEYASIRLLLRDPVAQSVLSLQRTEWTRSGSAPSGG